jgi:hypothetical protein
MMSGEREKKRGDLRMKVTIVTKEDDFADVTFERLSDDIEISPFDMQQMRKALKKEYRVYKRKRADAMDGGSVTETDAPTEVTMAVTEGGTAVLENGGDDGYDE